MTYRPTIFPELSNAAWAEVDLNALARDAFPNTAGANRLLDGAFCQSWVERIAAGRNADYTWGGYGEDRKHLWRGYYPDAGRVIHLGIDYNVPAGTLVSAPADCTIVHAMADYEMENGWGGRLILQLDQPWQGAPFLILGHLAHDDLPETGQSFKKGTKLTRTGQIHENGGWFPHLHVQCCSAEFFSRHKDDLAQLDGYYFTADDITAIAPDPAFLVGSSGGEGRSIRLKERRGLDPIDPVLRPRTG